MNTRDETPVHQRRADTQSDHFSTEPRVLLRLRVSRDSGQTWGPVTEVREDENLPLLDNPSALPPCACPHCTGRDSGTGASLPEVA